MDAHTSCLLATTIKGEERGKKRNKKKLHEPIKTSNAFTRSIMIQNSFNNPYNRE